ncbi:GNAT family N-acetyltransferase [Spiroplasma monobiae]|uniref:N-acetyltransferase domain-containing protein n=1 Tax=Spiroplasma monobiae MQ-1 TaxID=1336748 RepID=A0A2K9LTW8_SPISQ|nr:GNAT family N-acetyltransferase [Spiroplasma monobiae]AUM62518.1 hypothetical protein SMONO_v1c02690 [Spiroplasma monobiae MQ-1]
MKFLYKQKISENEGHDNLGRAYLSYFSDPINDPFEIIKEGNLQLFKFKKHENSIVTINWDYSTEDIDKFNQYSPKFLVNLTNKKYDNQELKGMKFKGGYTFMRLNLKGLTKFDALELEGATFEKMTNSVELDTFVDIVGTVFTSDVTSSKKFYGIFDEYKDLSELFLIKYNKDIVGTGHLIHFDKNSSIVDDIAISEKARGKGLATFLMKSLINWSIDNGKEELCLFGSDEAFNIYKKLGFKEEDFWLEQFELIY